MQFQQSVKTKEPRTFTDYLRVIFGKLLTNIGIALNNIGIHPNMLTVAGVVGNIIGAFYVSQGDFFTGGLIITLVGPVDALDGAVARARGEPQEFGAFVDSVSDRYIELFIFSGLLWHYMGEHNLVAGLLIFFAASGSVLVSYVRARAESLGFEAKVGLLTRVERYLVVGPSILFGYPLFGILIVAVGANLTAIHRIFHVRKQAREKKNQSLE